MRNDPTLSSPRTEILGRYYSRLINDIILMIANRQMASIYWSSVILTTILITFESPTLQPLLKEAPAGGTSTDSNWAGLGVITFFVVLKVVTKIREVTNAQVRFLETYLQLYRRRALHDTAQWRFRTGARASRWRSPEHKTGMELAVILERCVADTQRRLEARDAAIVGNTYYRLATLLRRASIRGRDSRAAGDYFDGLVAVSCTLLLEGNPVAAAQTFEHVTADEPEPTPPTAGRLRRLLSNLGDNLERHEKTVRSLGFLAVLLVLIATGQFGRLAEIFTK
ncbi:hypothetical protein ALI144C_03535 [Actinosynnema sp. ALI-1.44]|nr:hypothetical protein ALI144C_03535 [Actinosynnema sp. ALI-1.44]